MRRPHVIPWHEAMNDIEIRKFAEQKGLHPRTVERWLAYDTNDRSAVYRVVLSLKPSENHLRDIMDWLEEIALRDRCSLVSVLGEKSIEDLITHPRLGRGDKLRKVKDEIRRRRFPRLAHIEDSIHASIKELKLAPEIKVSLPAGLEGGCLTVQFTAADRQEFCRLVERLADAANAAPMARVFDRLAGMEVES